MTTLPTPPGCTFSLEVRSPDALFVADSPMLRDELQPGVAQALLEWAGTTRRSARLEVEFLVPRPSEAAREEQIAHLVNGHFLRVADDYTRRIADVFRYARAATVVGLIVVIILLGSAQAIPEEAGQVMAGVRESLTIFAWVAMWKPAELWLYQHWPLRHWRSAALRVAKARVCLVPLGTNGARHLERRSC